MPNCRKSLHHRPFLTSLPTTCQLPQEAEREPKSLSGSFIDRSHYGPTLQSALSSLLPSLPPTKVKLRLESLTRDTRLKHSLQQPRPPPEQQV